MLYTRGVLKETFLNGVLKMKTNELMGEIAREGYTIPSLATSIGIGKKALYEKMSGKSQFKQREIVAISKALKLSNEKMLNIFFAEQVS